MDMSLWTKLNPIVKRVKVKKLFFNRYLYKIKFYCPGARAIYSNNFEELRNLIYSRLSNETHWYALYENYQLSQNVRLNQLQFFQNLKDFKNFTIRVEEPFISIYSNHKEELYQISKICYPDRLNEVHLPESNIAQSILLEGEIISSSKNKFEYKIILKPYAFKNVADKEFLKNTLDNISESIRLTKNIVNFITSTNMWYNGGYMYAIDSSTAIFLKLAFPNLISSIFRVRSLEQ